MNHLLKFLLIQVNFCLTQRKPYEMLANEYTEDCLQKLTKPQLIVLSERDETKATIESLTEMNKEH